MQAKDRTAVLALSIAMLAATALARGAVPPSRPANPFFAMDTAFGDLPFASIKALGYDGVSLDFAREWPIEELDRLGLRLEAVYGGLDIDTGAGREAIEKAIRRLKGRGTVVWITLNGSKSRKPASESIAAATALLRPLAELALEERVTLSINPHAGFWIERFDDALLLANHVDRPALGVTFNLCHFLKTDKVENLKARLEAGRSRLSVVTINGADADGQDWDRLIQPLDRGTFDNRRLLEILHELGYAGPIGLPGYGVPGDKKENLERSRRAWIAILRKTIAGEPRPDRPHEPSCRSEQARARGCFANRS